MGLDYYVRVRKHMRSSEATPAALDVWRNKRFRMFGIAFIVAYFAIFIRCIYRIAEMSGGWGSEIMRDEISFLILDPTLVLVACSLLTIFHPGLFFPQMSNGRRRAEKSTPTTAPDLEAKKDTPADTGESGNETPRGVIVA
jgi:formate hydrogenlyase subunit 3/multisubunit Na+/H+ antiporter MnhD subunit